MDGERQGCQICYPLENQKPFGWWKRINSSLERLKWTPISAKHFTFTWSLLLSKQTFFLHFLPCNSYGDIDIYIYGCALSFYLHLECPGAGYVVYFLKQEWWIIMIHFYVFGCFRMIHYWLKEGIWTHESLLLSKANGTRNHRSIIEGRRKPTRTGGWIQWCFTRATKDLETYFRMVNLEKLRGIILVYNLHPRPEALHFSSLQKSLSESMWFAIYKEKLQ